MNWAIFDIVFSPYNIDQKWYPFILIFFGIFVLILLYLIFSYIRAFIIWLNGNSEIIKLQKDTNALLLDLIEIQNYQADEIEKIKKIIRNQENTEEHETIDNEDEDEYKDEDWDEEDFENNIIDKSRIRSPESFSPEEIEKIANEVSKHFKNKEKSDKK